MKTKLKNTILYIITFMACFTACTVLIMLPDLNIIIGGVLLFISILWIVLFICANPYFLMKNPWWLDNEEL